MPWAEFYICMYVCMWCNVTCKWLFVCARKNSLYVCMHVCMYACMYTVVFVHAVCKNVNVCMYLHHVCSKPPTWLFACPWRICMCVLCVWMCVDVCVCVQIHTRTHKQWVSIQNICIYVKVHIHVQSDQNMQAQYMHLFTYQDHAYASIQHLNLFIACVTFTCTHTCMHTYTHTRGVWLTAHAIITHQNCSSFIDVSPSSRTACVCMYYVRIFYESMRCSCMYANVCARPWLKQDWFVCVWIMYVFYASMCRLCACARVYAFCASMLRSCMHACICASFHNSKTVSYACFYGFIHECLARMGFDMCMGNRSTASLVAPHYASHNDACSFSILKRRYGVWVWLDDVGTFCHAIVVKKDDLTVFWPQLRSIPIPVLGLNLPGWSFLPRLLVGCLSLACGGGLLLRASFAGWNVLALPSHKGIALYVASFHVHVHSFAVQGRHNRLCGRIPHPPLSSKRRKKLTWLLGGGGLGARWKSQTFLNAAHGTRSWMAKKMENLHKSRQKTKKSNFPRNM